MAGKDLKYRVDVDASDAVRGLKDLGKAGEQAGKDLESSFDDSASAADKAAAAIREMGTKMDTEIRGAVEAADALATALGPELTGKIDIDQAVADLQRMGLSLDDIKGSADKLAGAFKDVDAQNMSRAAAGIDDTRVKTETLGKSADSSRGALANMIGNTAQDVSGLSSSLGVGIGQMAEYAADAALAGESLGSVGKNMALISGPILALAAGTALLNRHLTEQARIKAFRAEQVEGYSKAVDELGTGLAAVEQHLHNVADESFQSARGMSEFLSGSESIPDVAAAAAVLGLNYRDLSEAIVAGASDTDEGTEALKVLEAQLIRSGYSANLYGTLLEFVAEQQDAYATATHNSAAEQEFWAATAGDITRAMSANSVQLDATEIKWNRLLRDLRDGHIDTVKATEAWNELRDAQHLTNEEMAAMVQQKLDDQLEADTQAAGEAADKILEMRDALRVARDAAAEYNRIVTSADWGATAFEAADTALSGYFDKFMEAGDTVADQEEAYDNLGDALDGATEAGLSWSDTLFDLDSPQARSVRSSLRQLGDSLIPSIAEAFRASHGDIDVFKARMGDLGENVLQDLMDKFGLTRDQANALAQQLGLVPENVETMYELLGTEDAKLKLQLLQGVIEGLDKDVQAQIAYQISVGDYEGAVQTAVDGAQQIAADNPATIDVYANIEPALDAIWRLRQALQGALIIARIANDVAGRSVGASSAMTPAAAGVAATRAVPAAAAVTPVNVNIRAGVIGNRFDVERAVSTATRQAIRLAGRRQLLGAAP